MKIEKRLVESRTLPTGHKTYGLIKFWVCPNKSVLHGLIKYRVGSQVIPPYKKGE